VSWKSRLEMSIVLPDGRKIVTLADARDHILTYPKTVLERDHWMTAMEAVLMAAEKRGPMMFAHIGMAKALRAHSL
jgi:hypothetical protein